MPDIPRQRLLVARAFAAALDEASCATCDAKVADTPSAFAHCPGCGACTCSGCLGKHLLRSGTLRCPHAPCTAVFAAADLPMLLPAAALAAWERVCCNGCGAVCAGNALDCRACGSARCRECLTRHVAAHTRSDGSIGCWSCSAVLPEADLAQHLSDEALARLHTLSLEAALSCTVCGARGKPVDECTSCPQRTCEDCLRAAATALLLSPQYSAPRCPACSAVVPMQPLLDCLSSPDRRALVEKEVRASLPAGQPLVGCPTCGILVAPVAGEPAGEAETDTPLTEEQKRCYMLHRCRCPTCPRDAPDFCAGCGASPYHLGKTCAEALDPARCRFCDNPAVPPATVKTGLSRFFFRSKKKKKEKEKESDDFAVCSSPTCRERAAVACPHRLDGCSHPCGGCAGDSPCLPCTRAGCPCRPASYPDFCPICWVEPLSAAPCVAFPCGHPVHRHCLLQRLQAGWPGARITFGFMGCPMCGEALRGHKDAAVQAALTPLLKIRRDLEKRWIDRLRIEGLDDAPALTDPGSRYYRNPAKYAEHALCYYKCFRCSKPYFGGLKRCEPAADHDAAAEREVKLEELVCGGCVDKAAACPIHGGEFVQFKCRYCCKPAVWHCWGTTHFCDECHKAIPKPLPICEGPGRCPSGGDHPPNGQEFSLGCIACKASRETTGKHGCKGSVRELLPLPMP